MKLGSSPASDLAAGLGSLATGLSLLLGVSAAGYGFRTTPDLSVTTRAGRRFARVADGDELVAVTGVEGPEVFCLARSGNGLRFPVEEAAEQEPSAETLRP